MRTPEVLQGTTFENLGTARVGKVRDVYEQDDRLILITTDRHSSFDRIIAHIPHKGQVLNELSAWWCFYTQDIVPNHVLWTPDPNVTVAKKCMPLAIEAVVRGYLTGVTDTSIWTRYEKGERHFGGIRLPDGMRKNERLPMPLFDPTTKEEGHDRAIPVSQMIAEGLITAAMVEQVRAISFALFARGTHLAAERGYLLVDTKYEFGLDKYGRLTLIDEIHTPDSSRWWLHASYEERLERSVEPESFDKEFLRLWVRQRCDPYRDPIPEIPRELTDTLSRRYVGMYESIMRKPFQPGEEPVAARIARNLAPYAVRS